MPCCLATSAHAQDAAATIGKQRAAASRIEWEIREARHPTLGDIRFALIRNPVETQIGNSKLYSRAYISCEKATRKFAIELANARAPDDPKGLKPAALPRLVCSRPVGGDKVVQEEILTSWQVNEIGDALAAGLRAFPLRECASIRVEQEVELPPNWIRKTARIEYDILPYNREIDSIFAGCGEVSAYGPAAPAPVTAAPPAQVAAARPAPPAAPVPPPPAKPLVTAVPVVKPAAPPPPAPVQAAGYSWEVARVTSDGKTNMRAQPTLQSPILVQLDPGAVVLVQKTATDWWRAKSAGGKFEGFIREDRLVLK